MADIKAIKELALHAAKKTVPVEFANKGKTVIMVSSEMPELLGVCDRIVVMSGGRVAGEVDARNTTQEEIMTLAAKYV